MQLLHGISLLQRIFRCLHKLQDLRLLIVNGADRLVAEQLPLTQQVFSVGAGARTWLFGNYRTDKYECYSL